MMACITHHHSPEEEEDGGRGSAVKKMELLFLRDARGKLPSELLTALHSG